jgi:hypothetical protein
MTQSVGALSLCLIHLVGILLSVLSCSVALLSVLLLVLMDWLILCWCNVSKKQIVRSHPPQRLIPHFLHRAPLSLPISHVTMMSNPPNRSPTPDVSLTPICVLVCLFLVLRKSLLLSQLFSLFIFFCLFRSYCWWFSFSLRFLHVLPRDFVDSDCVLSMLCSIRTQTSSEPFAHFTSFSRIRSSFCSAASTSFSCFHV